MNGALHGIRVLDLSRVLAGPWAGQLLGDYGAEVIKVERPQVGDDTRHWGPPWLRDADGDETAESAYFLAANRNKRSITLDISHAAGQRVLRELVAKSDILIENFRVGTLARFGLDWATLSDGHPALIYCSISAYGQ
ncbi:MAG: CoA transferase, partial [Woeseiaceae bacterium]